MIEGSEITGLLLTSDVLFDEFRNLHPDEVNRITVPDASKQKNALHRSEEEEKRLQDVYNEAVHSLKKNDKHAGQTALCLSGGGIRSAAFCLGIMQGLARLKLLSQFDYLSTVSGGGYIGGWLSAWATREFRLREVQLGEIENQLAKTCGASGCRTGIEPKPLVELRQNHAFITPKIGLGSADTWAAMSIIIRNMLLNWLVFLPLVASILFVPRVVEWLLVAWTKSKEGADTFLLAMGYHFWDLAMGKIPQQQPLQFFWDWHYWLDSIGAVLVIWGLVNSIVNRSRNATEALDEDGFRNWVMLPLVVGAFLLVMQSCYWVPNGSLPDEKQFLEWVTYGAAAFCVAYVLAFAWMAGIIFWVRKEKLNFGKLRRAGLEFCAQIVAGAVIGALIWSGLWLRHVTTRGHPEDAIKYDAVFGVPWYLMAFLLGQVLLAALTSRLYPKAGDRHREWWARASGYYGAWAVMWVAAFWLVIFGWDAVKHLQTEMLAVAGGSGAISLLGASPISGTLGETLKGIKLSVAKLLTLASIVFLLCLAIWIAHSSMLLLEAMAPVPFLELDPETLPNATTAEVNLKSTVLATLALFIFSLVTSFYVNVNYFSLNAMYRNRLVRAFLGASNAGAKDRSSFDGFADSDNLEMHELRRGPKAKLFHVVNITLNLTATDNKAWQERKAASFICTPLHTGGNLVGYRSSKAYCNGITLGTAMSLSGAAVSPNWGYHSSTATSFVMTIFNARLGGWFGNPKDPTGWNKNGPDASYRRFIQEALGFASDKQPFVYLSDGGHFENLALYEMVRRRCHVIVVCDAGADFDCTLEDLGNAVRKIYIDLGVEIDFERIDVRAREKMLPKTGIYAAVGRVRYPEKGANDGKIIYIKPGLYVDAPADVKAYAAANAKFPHDITLNQWFTESQFESYRALGEHAIKMMTGLRDPAAKTTNWPPQSPEIVDLLDFCEHVEHYLDVNKELSRV